MISLIVNLTGWAEKMERQKGSRADAAKMLQNPNITEVKISVHAHGSAEAIKGEIRSKITNYKKEGWDFVSMAAHGPFLSLKFNRTRALNGLPLGV